MRVAFWYLMILLLWSFAVVAQKAAPVSKISPALVARIQYGPVTDSLDVVISFKKKPVAQSPPIRILNKYQNNVVVRVATATLPQLLKDSAVLFADVFKKPVEELTSGSLDLAVNKINTAHDHFAGIDGTNILASVKEQQPDTSDIDYKGRYVNTNAAAATSSSHASIMATTLAGAGNSSPFAKGVAPAARITSTSFLNLLPEDDAYYQLFQIPIQNHSYGTVVENYYGAEAAAYDQNVVSNPTLVHVFSAGNSGLATGAGPYSMLTGWGNLTGNFKTAKNVLVVGAIDSFYNVAAASSKGPVFDGRVKPDLVAFGEDGSSGAAALTSGTVALLQQAYQNKTGILPPAALVKAVLLNSADDVSQLGPDYSSGYGSLNGYNAIATINEQHFFDDSIGHGDLKKFVITVPPNTATIKITLAWTDPAAVVNTSVSLVNDLDLTITGNDGTVWLPWVLQAAPDAASLQTPAVRQRDTLNNVEQVTINNPTAGAYTIAVTGTHIVTAQQQFSIAYELTPQHYFEWTFPTKEDVIKSGGTAAVRWQTTEQGTAQLDYNTDGNTWRRISDSVQLETGFFKWAVPETFSTAQLRMRIANNTASITDTFVISRPVTVRTGFQCGDSVLLLWNALPVEQYQVYNLGREYLQPVIRTADTAFVIKTGTAASRYYSVAPIVAGRIGMRSYTIDYSTQGTGCYVRSFYLQSQTGKAASFALQLGTAYHLAGISFQKLNGAVTTLQTVTALQGLDFTFSDTALQQGANAYHIQFTLTNGAIFYSDTVRIYYIGSGPVLVFPNPAAQYQPITILTRNLGAVRIAVFDASGRLMLQRDVPDLINRVVLPGLAKGLYLLRIFETGGATTTQKLMVF